MYSLIDEPTQDTVVPGVNINRPIDDYYDLNAIYYPFTTRQMDLILGWPLATPVQMTVDSQDDQGWTPYALADVVYQILYAYYYAAEEGENHLDEDAPDIDQLRLTRVVGKNDGTFLIAQIDKDITVGERQK